MHLETSNMYSKYVFRDFFMQGIKSFLITPLDRLCLITLYVFSVLKNSWYFPDHPGGLIRGGNKTLLIMCGESQIPH